MKKNTSLKIEKAMKMRQRTLTLLCAGMLSGCGALAPQYERPEAPVAAAYPGADLARLGQATRAAADVGWREFFPDERLQALIAQALENNRDLRTAALRIEEARAQYGIQRAAQLPGLNGVTSASRARLAQSQSPAGNAAVTESYQVGVGLAAFELDFFGRVRNLSDAALALYVGTEEARRSATIALVAEVAKAHLAERAYAERLALAQRTLEARKEAYRLAQQRFEVGATSALDLRQNEVVLHSAQVAVAALSRQRAQAENALALLIGQPLVNLPPTQRFSEHVIVTDIPAGLPSELLVRRPDIRATEQRLMAANADIGAARAAFFPRISLTGGFGTASNDLSGLFEAGARTWSFVPQLVLPIFDAGRNRASLNLAEVRKELAVVEYERAIQTAFREVADALIARAALDEQVEAQRALLDAQSERLKLAELRHRGGVASYLEVLDAQREWFDAEQAWVQARLLRMTNAIDLYRSLGGGLREATIAVTDKAG